MRLLLEGNSRFAIASKMKLAPRTVYNIVEKLVYLGYIRQVPGTKSPAIYEQLLSPETNPLTGDYKGKGGILQPSFSVEYALDFIVERFIGQIFVHFI